MLDEVAVAVNVTLMVDGGPSSCLPRSRLSLCCTPANSPMKTYVDQLNCIVGKCNRLTELSKRSINAMTSRTLERGVRGSCATEFIRSIRVDSSFSALSSASGSRRRGAVSVDIIREKSR